MLLNQIRLAMTKVLLDQIVGHVHQNYIYTKRKRKIEKIHLFCDLFIINNRSLILESHIQEQNFINTNQWWAISNFSCDLRFEKRAQIFSSATVSFQ